MKRSKGRNFSFSDQKNQRHRMRWVVLGIIIFFVVYSFFTSLAFSLMVLENESMAPNLRAGERFIFSSFNIYSIIPGLDMEKGSLPFSRGNIVLVNMYKGRQPGIIHGFFDVIIRFITAQKVSLTDKSGLRPEDYLFAKRVVGIPGDEITMTNYVVRVKAGGSAYSLTEFEMTEQIYTLEIPQMPALWDVSLPFSGNIDSIILGDNECFVLSDDRSNTNDSRTWGPIPVRSIRGKALYRYWPFTRMGRP